MPNWTDEQLRAIEARGTNVLLSAAAGSGKTTVLVERVLRLVAEDGIDVDRMLVVTFTRAAASDMRAKLSREMNARAAAGDARCREQLLRLDAASITTLHGFCADFLRGSFEAAGVDPAFRVLDEAVAARLRDDAVTEALEEAYDAGGEALLALDYGRGPKGVRAALEALLDRMEEQPDPEGWLAMAARCDEDALARWQDELKDSARRSLGAALVQLREALTVPGCPAAYDRAMRADIAAVEGMLALEDYDDLFRALSEMKMTTARAGKADDPGALEAVKQLREGAKRAVQGAKIRKLPLATARADAQKLAVQLRKLGEIALRAAALYDEKKDAQSGLTYADLEHRTLRALRDPETARSVRERYDYVFVDEYQDTSGIQEAILGAVRGADNLFMVGDVKQSIYRFRLAEPRLFLEKYRDYGAGQGGALLPLTRNFRSRRGILDFVNLVFERVMTGGDAEIAYDDLARLNPGLPDADAPGEAVEIHLIDGVAEAQRPPEEGEDGGETADLKALEREGVFIARTIRRMMAEDATLRFRDFAVLTRSKTGPFAAMMPILLAHGIPAYADGQAGFYDTVEITWLLNLLKLVENRRSDVALIALLRSPAAGLTADELARVRAAYRNMPYVDAAERYAAERDNALAGKIGAFLEKAAGWRLVCGSLDLGAFVRLLLDESGFYTYAGALPGGPQRQANLDRFVRQADRFDRDISGSLTRFLRYTEGLRLKQDGDAAHLLGENDDVVRMMSVHKSKGLEFRVVIGAQLSRRYGAGAPAEGLVAHRALGVGMPYCDPELRTRRATLPQLAIVERHRREDAAEEMRILYVLLTRAREKLILVGTAQDVARANLRWRALAGVPFAASSQLDLLMAARCGAEAEGLPLCSALEVHAAADIAPEARDESAPAARFEEILAHPERFADPALSAAMAWRYPDPEDARRPLKLTASGLIRELEGPEEVPALLERPQFLLEDARRMTGAERGTAYHRAMQLLDLRALAGLEGPALTRAVGAQLDAAANRRLLTDAQRDVVKPGRLARFLEGEVGRRLRAAKVVRREWPFNVRLRAGDALTPEEAERFADAELLVQGSVDCCFEEDGAWVLLDYKTDRTDDPDALRAHYRRQLAIYALALETITEKPVRERLLCLLASGDVLPV